MTAGSAANVDALYERAIRNHEAGQLAEAETLYREILAADPRQLDCLHLLGVIALQRGDHGAAIDLIGQAIAVNDGISAYHASIAEAFRARGDLDRAVAHYRRAIEIEPRFAEAQARLATTLLAQGEAEKAIAPARNALTLEESDGAKTLFVRCVTAARALPSDTDFHRLMYRALTEPWARPVEFAQAGIEAVRQNPAIGDAVMRAREAWPRRLSAQEIAPAMGALAGDPLLHAVLEATPVCDIGLERLLTSVRAVLLEAAMKATAEIADAMLPFAAALARQCFINEYAFAVSEAERSGAERLRAAAAGALRANEPFLALHMIALAAYVPLHTLTDADALLGRPWPDAMARLVAQQVREPEKERRYRVTIPSLTEVEDTVSRAVQRQYEENPYPRWVKVAPTRPAASIAHYLREEFPLAPLHDPGKDTADVLIAGCGTGQQAIDAAQRFPQARVRAIDLSRASLCYAKRKASEAGLANLELAQADILKLGSTGRAFDVIEASGVLHHLGQPMRGWEVLLSLLRPGGFMRLGFYSELARADIVAARTVIAERGYRADPDGIRRCRQDVLSFKPGTPVRNVGASPDFFSVSACRDLLFHVEEHRFTLPVLRDFLLAHDLSFIGFELDAPVLQRYRARFPEDRTMTDLAQWHGFESENPGTFAGMYQFWVQRTY